MSYITSEYPTPLGLGPEENGGACKFDVPLGCAGESTTSSRGNTLIGRLTGMMLRLNETSCGLQPRTRENQEQGGEIPELSETESDSSDSSGAKSSPRRGRSRNRRSVSVGARRRKKHSDPAKEKHIDWFSHGKIWTIIAIIFAWAGLSCSVIARKSTAFVSVDIPIYVDASFEEVDELGMVNYQLCYNESYTGYSGCFLHELDSTQVNDRTFQFARSTAFLAEVLGGFVSVFITVTPIWQTINLRPVGLGFLAAYFLQSFTFLFFDSEICQMHSCSLRSGALNSIVASFCWLIACIGTARMDVYKFRLRKRRESNSKRNKLPVRSKSPNMRPKQTLNREISDTTAATAWDEESNRQPFPQRDLNPQNAYSDSRHFENQGFSRDVDIVAAPSRKQERRAHSQGHANAREMPKTPTAKRTRSRSPYHKQQQKHPLRAQSQGREFARSSSRPPTTAKGNRSRSYSAEHVGGRRSAKVVRPPTRSSPARIQTARLSNQPIDDSLYEL